MSITYFLREERKGRNSRPGGVLCDGQRYNRCRADDKTTTANLISMTRGITMTNVQMEIFVPTIPCY